MPTATAKANQHWSQWWSQGHITSFGTALRDNYEGYTREHWWRCFDDISGGKLLDIATGNGALATLAVEYAAQAGKDFQVTATDLAEIGEQTTAENPDIHRWREQVSFHGGTPCERQPFEDESFDGVLSQYGFEYSDIDSTLAEVQRLLKPGGQFLAIAHNAASQVVARQRSSASVYLAALEQLKLFRLLERHLASWGKAKGQRAIDKLGNKPKVQKSGQELEQGLRQFAGQFPNDETAARVFCAIDDLRQEALDMGPARRAAAVKQERDSFSAALARLQDLFRAALDERGVSRLKSQALQLGFGEVDIQPFYAEDGGLAGWSVRLQK